MENMTENWRPVVGYSDYEVSDLGGVRSYKPTGPNRPHLTTPKYLKQFVVCGYWKVNLTPDAGPRKAELVHRLVAAAFHGPCPEGQECRHLNGNRKDARAVNLAWGTRKENAADSIRHGTAFHKSIGEKHPFSVLTEEDVRRIRSRHGHGDSVRVMASELGVTRGAVYHVLQGRTWNHCQ